MSHPALRVAARLARPVLLWGHDWVVNTGVEQFRRATIHSTYVVSTELDERGPEQLDGVDVP